MYRAGPFGRLLFLATDLARTELLLFRDGGMNFEGSALWKPKPFLAFRRFLAFFGMP